MLIVIPLMQIVSWGLSAVPADLPPQSLVSNWRVTIAVVSSAEVGAVDGWARRPSGRPCGAFRNRAVRRRSFGPGPPPRENRSRGSQSAGWDRRAT